MTVRRLTGWGRTSPSTAEVCSVSDRREAASALASVGRRGALVRGLGRSYGDAAQNGGGLVLELDGAPRIDVDAATGMVRAGGGTTIDQLIRHLVPLGWFVPVTPGTRQVTVGGAVAADIHGKNHHVDGSWGNHVREFDLLHADGTLQVVTPTSDPDVFWATHGGMGLTGAVMSCRFQAIPIQSDRVLVETWRTADLQETMAVMADHDGRYRYSVAWIDSLATGARMGRGVVTMGDHAPMAESPSTRTLSFDDRTLVSVPPIVPGGLLNRLTIAAFNEVWYRKAPRRRTGELQGIGEFFHPLDMVGEWNRLYGPAGMLQYQIVVPFGAEAHLERVVERLAEARAASFLTVLKRFGAASSGHLSFPLPGWTLTLDIPTAVKGLGPLLDELDRDVVDIGGRVYLAKDSRVSPDLLHRMYPRLDEWRAICDRVDPGRVWQSDLSRRLGLRAPLGSGCE